MGTPTAVLYGDTGAVLDEVDYERRRQDSIWGEQNHPDGTGSFAQKVVARKAKRAEKYAAKTKRMTWRHILMEEVGEAFAERDPQALRAELVQVAAVAVAWVEAIDRRG